MMQIINISIIYLLFSINLTLIKSLPFTPNVNYSNTEEYLNAIATGKVPDIIQIHGYTVEVHSVLTDDGYILEIHRIPNPGSVPIYLQHGLLDSSAAWVIMGPEKSLAYILSDIGFDVWMGNSRGNHYSRQHLILTDKSDKFWDFSWHEIGLYDLTSTIDYIIQNTTYEKIHYVGHSQGTTIFWVMCSQRPEYNHKIASMHALAPVAYLDNVESLFIQAVTQVLGPIKTMTNLLGINEFMPRSDFLQRAGLKYCNEESLTRHICSNILFSIVGFNKESMNMTMLPAIIGHLPAGASVKQMIHFGQIHKSGIFRQYDYGYWENYKIYNQLKPPEYNFSSITAPIYFYYSENDLLASVSDVKKLYEKLSNGKDIYLVPNPKFNHLDFLWALNVTKILYNVMLKNLNNIIQI